jgi:hypothetical protein
MQAGAAIANSDPIGSHCPRKAPGNAGGLGRMSIEQSLWIHVLGGFGEVGVLGCRGGEPSGTPAQRKTAPERGFRGIA